MRFLAGSAAELEDARPVGQQRLEQGEPLLPRGVDDPMLPVVEAAGDALVALAHDVRRAARDHVAAAVAVGLHGTDRLTGLEPRVDALDAGKRTRLVERADRLHDAGRERPRRGREEADREWLLE